MAPALQSFPAQNYLLAALPRHEYELLAPRLETVHFPKGKVLFEPNDPVRYAYFPHAGIVSLLSFTMEGETMEVAMVGREGVIGIPVILRADRMPYRVVAQLPADAAALKAEVLRDFFDRGGRFQHLLLSYTQTLLTQVAQSALCNRFHTVEERLCRWLRVARDRTESSAFDVTHEFLSQMIGAPRTGVSVAAGALQRARIIRYSRGRMTILDWRGVELRSCECYEVIKEDLDRFLAA